MNPTRWRVTALLVLALVAQLLLGCGATESPTDFEFSPSPSFAVFATPIPSFATPIPVIVQAVNPGPERVQGGQAGADADIAKAASTPTLTGDQVRQTVAVEAQVIVAGELTQTAQSVDATNAAPLAATSSAATQTVLLVQEYEQEQDNFVNRIVLPLIPVMAAILFILLLVLVIALTKRQFLPTQWQNSTRIKRETNLYPNSLVTIDGEVSDYYHRPPHPVNPPVPNPENIPQLPCEKLVFVEVINANEPPIVHWVDEVERLLADDHGGGI